MHLDYKLVQLRRFLVARRLYGLSNALRMLWRAGQTTKERTFMLPGGLPFTFRGRTDLGVVSHFCIEGYFIEDVPEKPVRTIIDCGANIGDETARFYLHYPGATIAAVEAEPRNFVMLQKNFGAVKRVRLIQGGVWSATCRLKVIPSPTGNVEAFRVEETTDEAGSIEAFTIDALMAKMEWDEIDILKLDIEGAEHEIFTRNYEGWIGKVNAFIFELPDSDHPGTTREIFRALGEQAFNAFVCGENLILIKQGLPWKFRKVFGLNEKRVQAHHVST